MRRAKGKITERAAPPFYLYCYERVINGKRARELSQHCATKAKVGMENEGADLELCFFVLTSKLQWHLHSNHSLP